MDDETILTPENQEPAPQEEKDPLKPENQEPSPQEEKGSFKLDLYYWTQALVMALVFLILSFTLVGRVIGVVGKSMLPTLHQGDLVLLQSVGYTPKQGDVVVLRKPTFLEEPVVKRVIAVGGQHVKVDYVSGKVYVDGAALDDPYINEPMRDPLSADMTVLDVTVPEGSIYVMGDNRNHSSDSRHKDLGTVDNRYILGKALCVVMPFSDFGAVK